MPRLIWLAPALIALIAAAFMVRAQLEGSERGIPAIDSSSSYEVGGISVDVAAKSGEQARQAGWRLAQRKGWKMLWSRMNGGREGGAPGLSDSTLDAIVSAIVVEQEQIGATRYVARLGVLFDRSRAGALLGGHGQLMRSPPVLLIPVQIAGGTPTSFELRNPWQAAWARFRTGNSPIDYVRSPGTGSDPLLLNLAQSRRPGRGWWRMLLDYYGASDIVVPEVYLQRLWPGGPVIGRFYARHGPDRKLLGSFALRIARSDGEGLTTLLDEGVRRIDALYSQALRDGRLRADPSLQIEEEEPEEIDEAVTLEDIVGEVVEGMTGGTALSLQIDTPDGPSLAAAEAMIRAIPGIRAASTTSLALGGVSVIRVNFGGTAELFKTALTSRGWRVEGAGDVLRLRRAPPSAVSPPAPPPPAPSP